MLKFIFIFICEIGYLRCHICRVLTRKWKILQGSAQTIQQANNLVRKTFKGNLTRRQIKSKLLKKTLIFSAPVKSTAAEGSKKLKTNTKSSKKNDKRFNWWHIQFHTRTTFNLHLMFYVSQHLPNEKRRKTQWNGRGMEPKEKESLIRTHAHEDWRPTFDAAWQKRLEKK